MIGAFRATDTIRFSHDPPRSESEWTGKRGTGSEPVGEIN